MLAEEIWMRQILDDDVVLVTIHTTLEFDIIWTK